MTSPRVYDLFGAPGKHVPPSALVRRWDEALLVFAVCAGVTPLLLAWAVSTIDPSVWFTVADAFWAVLGDPDSRERLTWCGASLSFVLVVPGLLAGCWVARRSLRPRSRRVHVAGPQLLKGDAAVHEARQRACPPDEPFAMPLHPEYRMSKRNWSQHVFVVGGVGAGKTVIMSGWLDHIIRMSRNDGYRGLTAKAGWRCFIYDVKGDMGARYKEPIIVSPYDKRSYVWAIAKDCRSAVGADVLAENLLPPRPSESNPFFSNGARMIISALVRMLQATKGTTWTWQDLRAAFLLSPEAKIDVLRAHHPMAAVVLNDPKAKSLPDLMATVAIAGSLVDSLASAWPPELARKGKRDRTFSLREWASDGYNGRPHVLVQGGGSTQLTNAYVGAMINLAATFICSSELPDNEGGRFLGFLIDELASVGKLNTRLWSLSRSKGCCVMAATQMPEQLDVIYGKEDAQSLMAMSGTTIYARIGAGPIRDRLAQHAGRHRLASIVEGDRAQEDNQSILQPNDLTDGLGFRKKPPRVTAIVDQGGDLLELTWPCMDFPKVRAEQEPSVIMQPTRIVVPSITDAPTTSVDTLEILDRIERVRPPPPTDPSA